MSLPENRKLRRPRPVQYVTGSGTSSLSRIGPAVDAGLEETPDCALPDCALLVVAAAVRERETAPVETGLSLQLPVYPP